MTVRAFNVTPVEILLVAAIFGIPVSIVFGGMAACRQTPRAAREEAVAEAEAKRLREISDEHYEAWVKADEAAILACLKRGGIPIQSSWDSRLKDCK